MARRYIRDWRGRFAKISSRRVTANEITRAEIALQTKQRRESIATALYRKRSEQIVAKHEYQAMSDPNIGKVHEIALPTYSTLLEGDHDTFMHTFDKLPTEQRIAMRKLDIRKASNVQEAQMIFRARHGTKVRTNGWTEPGIDRKGAIECFASLDDMLTKYPDVDLQEFNAKDPRKFPRAGVVAHCARYIDKTEIGFNRYWLENPEAYTYTQLSGIDRGWNPPVNDSKHGLFGCSVVHEFGHALDYTAYIGQWAQDLPALNRNKPTPEQMQRLDEIKVQLDEIADLPEATSLVERGDRLARKLQLTKEAERLLNSMAGAKYPKERYPTIAQGRNAAMRQAMVRKWNEHNRQPSGKAMSQKRDDFEFYRLWLFDKTSSYSVKDDGPRREDPNRNMVLRPVPLDTSGKYHFNWSELVAEGFTDVELNGDNAWEPNKAIHETLTWQYRQKNQGLKAKFQK